MESGFKKYFLHLLIVCFVLGFLGCRSQEPTVSSPVNSPQQFSEDGEIEVPNEWWTEFDDKQLNSLVDTALSSNFDSLNSMAAFAGRRGNY